ncbi:hypothetical protein K2173_011184 [Erythroxylum novogranatense]|uniref:Holocarboxylase synthetase n=1 Tax=Erythroxylum novogranatense TaxID=1862640 RepID=A0AAV8TT63_9ROSI|nr:hypothetical protein K2173_011184 [Erythroxylum novogranatense]
MGKKRKSIATSLDEVDRTMYASFCSAANSLSQLYTQAMNHQKLSFQAGERHGLEKLYQWIRRQQEEGSRVLTVDILNYIQPSMSPRAPHQHQNSQPNQFSGSGLSISSGSTGPTIANQHCDQQTKNAVFSNALSSPIRRSLQNYHIAQGGYYPACGPPSGNQNREPNPLSSNDSSMDI